MNTRNLTSDEAEKKKTLTDLAIAHELLFLTDTGLAKYTLDATTPIVSFLKKEQVHDFDLQLQGEDHKVSLPCILLSEGQHEETRVSLYRPNSKSGDPRFWPRMFGNYASPNQVFALLIVDSHIVLLNLSDGQPLDAADGSDFFEMLGGTSWGSNEFTGKETEVEEVASREIDEPSRFEVSSYGWDSDVEGLVKRMNRGDIKLPRFQRGFVWTTTEQSRFIESLILGLPVPNIFLAKDGDSKILNIIDGQQRLKTLQRYLSGEFPISNSKKIHKDLRGCYFSREVAKTAKSKILEDADERTLSDSILHSIVIRPDPSSDSPDYGYEYNNAVIQIFRRLNTSGKALQPQEVRSCIFYGPFDELLHDLNKTESWRSLFGAKHSRCKDVETILRFLALSQNFENYKAPMPSFLDRFMEENRNIGADKALELRLLFETTTKLLFEACGESLFKKSNTLLLSKFDAVTVGFAKANALGKTFESEDINSKVKQLLEDQAYINSSADFINDTGNVVNRIETAIKIFAG